MIDPETRQRYEAELADLGLTVAEVDNDRPWGGELMIAENQLEPFVRAFFPAREGQLQQLARPKLLLVAPHQRLSWQYHSRRGEVWQVVAGPVEAVTGADDDSHQQRRLETGTELEVGLNVRHRLGALAGWGAVAEVWINTDVDHPSDEDDIVRVADDYERI